CSTRMRVRRTISSKDRTSSRASHGSPAAGMQYTQRKLQRSVTEIRRSSATRPNVSSNRTGGFAELTNLVYGRAVGTHASLFSDGGEGAGGAATRRCLAIRAEVGRVSRRR